MKYKSVLFNSPAVSAYNEIFFVYLMFFVCVSLCNLCFVVFCDGFIIGRFAVTHIIKQFIIIITIITVGSSNTSLSTPTTKISMENCVLY
jgi:hypothetical protein